MSQKHFLASQKNTNSIKLFTIAMEQHVFYYLIDYGGYHTKDVAIDTATEVNLHFQKLMF